VLALGEDRQLIDDHFGPRSLWRADQAFGKEMLDRIEARKLVLALRVDQLNAKVFMAIKPAHLLGDADTRSLVLDQQLVDAVIIHRLLNFLHKIVDGPADKSYGIQVAKLAGLPKEVVERAKQIYNTLEMVENDLGKLKIQNEKFKTKTKKIKAENQDQVTLF